MVTGPKNFLEVSYDELEELNLEAKSKLLNHVSEDELKEEYIRYLSDQKAIKAVTVAFTDLEGRFHMIDYDKKFLLGAYTNLTFDGSSVRGFSAVRESDLRLEIDWGSFRWLPSDILDRAKCWSLP
jgi:glutamine synthetase